MTKSRCPICDRPMETKGPQEWPDWPFCGPRCKLIDLGRWLGEDYRVAATPKESDPEDTEIPPNPAAPSAVPHSEEA